MQNQQQVTEIFNEIRDSQQKGYLSEVQVQIVESRLNYHLTYDDLIHKYEISGRTALTHALIRTSSLEHWERGMKSDGNSYLCKYDKDLFFSIIGNAADDSNCISCIYALSLAYYLKKKEFKSFSFIKCNQLQRFGH